MVGDTLYVMTVGDASQWHDHVSIRHVDIYFTMIYSSHQMYLFYISPPHNQELNIPKTPRERVTKRQINNYKKS